MLLNLLISIILISVAFTKVQAYSHPDVGLNVRELIEKYGYPFENHTVVTDDGYILELHRIPYGKNVTNKSTRPVVLLVPGIFCGSSVWVTMGTKRSLGFLLADIGYDVWLMNYRGTTWSRKHTYLSPDKDKKMFWDYSFHEIGTCDLPASIDYVLHVTRQEKLFYIGHSQGTTSIFALTTIKPEYNKKIRLAATLAPVAYDSHTKTPVVFLLRKFMNEIMKFSERFQIYELMPHSSLIVNLGDILCSDGSILQDVCAGLFFLISGFNKEEMNKTMLPVIISNSPAGASIKQFIHYVQLFASNTFRQYDYGYDENMIKYGQAEPPIYDLSIAKVPFALYYGDKDAITTFKDVERLVAELPNVVAKVVIEQFNHLDYTWGINVVEKLYNDLLALMNKY